MSLEIYLDAEIESTQRCTSRLKSSWIGDALGGCDWASLEMQLEGKFSEIREAFQGCNQASLEMYFGAKIE